MKKPIFIAALIILVSCNKQDEFYTNEINGVKHIHNEAPLWGDELKVKLEFVQQMGGAKEDDENMQFFRPHDVERDNSGNYYILDMGNHRIQIFDKNLKYIRSVGSRGQGPGEFQESLSIVVDSSRQIYLMDFFVQKVYIYSPKGKYKRSVNVGSSSTSFEVSSGGKFVFRKSITEITSDQFLLKIVDLNGKVITEFCRPRVLDIDYLVLFRASNNVLFTMDNNDNIYVVFYSQNRIEKYSPDGVLMMTIDRPIYCELEYISELTVIPSGNRQRKVLMAKPPKISGGCGIDHKGRLWVLTYKKEIEEGDVASDIYELELYNDQGILLTKVPSPNINFDSIRVVKNNIYFMDPFQEMCVYEYKIVDLK